MKIKDFSMSQIWFALALVLTTATQLRWAGLPIGPGELMLVIWLIIAGLQVVKQKRIPLSSSLKLFIAFWSLVLILLFAGWLVGLFQGVFSIRAGIYNLLAYIFICLFTLIAVTYLDSKQTIMIGKLVLFFAVVGLAPLWIYGQWFDELVNLRLWYGSIEHRFLGWAIDPNQTAILITPLPFIAFYYFRYSINLANKSLFLGLLGASIILGLATKSDSLKVAWLGAALVYFFLALQARVKPTKMVIISAVILMFCSIGIYILGPKIYASVEQMYYLGDQGPDRIALWINGLKATMSSPLVGFGPGAYSGIEKPFSGCEAHNTFIDWMTNTGIAGFLLLFSLLAWIFIKAIVLNNNEEVVAVLTSITIVSLFLYVIRHPVWWFYLLWAVSSTSMKRGTCKLNDA